MDVEPDALPVATGGSTALDGADPADPTGNEGIPRRDSIGGIEPRGNGPARKELHQPVMRLIGLYAPCTEHMATRHEAEYLPAPPPRPNLPVLPNGLVRVSNALSTTASTRATSSALDMRTSGSGFVSSSAITKI